MRFHSSCRLQAGNLELFFVRRGFPLTPTWLFFIKRLYLATLSAGPVDHATRVVISRLDAVHSRFLLALVSFHLAPLPTCWDIAMLGLIHRTILGKVPSQFAEFFRRGPQHSAKLFDPRATSWSTLIKRSALCLVSIYNSLPHIIVCTKTVSAFQKGLQELIVSFAVTGHPQSSEVL